VELTVPVAASAAMMSIASAMAANVSAGRKRSQ
jgi:hypothetical protein